MGRDGEYADCERKLLDGYQAAAEAMQALYVLALEDGDLLGDLLGGLRDGETYGFLGDERRRELTRR